MSQTNPQPASPEQLAMARRIAADGYYPLREDQVLVPCGRERILSGDMDHTVQVQTALAAIIETTEAAAKLSVREAELARKFRPLGSASALEDFATALRSFDHLRASNEREG